jgi:NTP pyrophosphatase (non-canonical NTP hydrolase)
MTQLQYELITEWQDQIFTKATPLSCVNHLEEEVRELKEKTEQGILDKSEIADCFMLLMGYCNTYHLKYEDVVKAIDDKYLINRHQRVWGEVNEKGYVKHIDK